MIIALSGFMGCGKTNVGKALHKLLKDFDFIDLDDFIENDSCKKVCEIFSIYGEKAFRDKEFNALQKIFGQYGDSGRNLLLSLGGGTLTNAGSAGLVKNNTIRVYLRASLDTLEENLKTEADKRPLLQGAGLRKKIEELMAERADLYEDGADYIIDTDGKTYSETAAEIASALKLI